MKNATHRALHRIRFGLAYCGALAALAVSLSALAQFTPGPGVTVLCKTGVESASVTSTAEQVLFTCPVRSLSQANALRITAGLINGFVMAGTNTIRVRLGGLTGTAIFTGTMNASGATGFLYSMVENRGVTTSQYATSILTTDTVNTYVAASATAAVNFSTGVTLVITSQKSVGADFTALELATVELL